MKFEGDTHTHTHTPVITDHDHYVFACVYDSVSAISVYVQLCSVCLWVLVGVMERLSEISDPSSKDFGKHMSYNDVHDMLRPNEDSFEVIYAWLASYDIGPDMVEKVTPNGDFVRFTITVGTANALLDTEYWIWEHEATHRTWRRVKDGYHVPLEVEQHLDFISPTLRFPPRNHLGEMKLVGTGLRNKMKKRSKKQQKQEKQEKPKDKSEMETGTKEGEETETEREQEQEQEEESEYEALLDEEEGDVIENYMYPSKLRRMYHVTNSYGEALVTAKMKGVGDDVFRYLFCFCLFVTLGGLKMSSCV